MIIAGIDQKGKSIYVTDPSGTYIQYAAIAIGAGADEVNEFFEKNYNADMSLEDAASLAIAAINLKSEEKDVIKNVKMAKLEFSQVLEVNITMIEVHTKEVFVTLIQKAE